MLGPGRPAPTGRHPQRLQVGHWTCFGRFGGRRHLGRHLPGKRLGHEVSSVKDAAPLPLRRRPDQAQGHWTKVWGRTCHLCKHGHHQTQRSTPLRAWHCIQHANHQGYLSNCKLMRQAQGRGLDSSHPHLEPRSHWPNWKGGGTPKTQVCPPWGNSTLEGRWGAALFYMSLLPGASPKESAAGYKSTVLSLLLATRLLNVARLSWFGTHACTLLTHTLDPSLDEDSLP